MTVSIIQRAALARRVDALFRAMSTDFLLREQFVTNPAQILSEYVHGKAPSPERAAIANQLVYAVMAHPRLLAWLRDYTARHRRHPPSLDRAAYDFTRAVVHHGAHHVVIALARSSVASEPIDFEAVWAVLFGSTGVSYTDPGDTGTGTAGHTGTGTTITQTEPGMTGTGHTGTGTTITQTEPGMTGTGHTGTGTTITQTEPGMTGTGHTGTGTTITQTEPGMTGTGHTGTGTTITQTEPGMTGTGTTITQTEPGMTGTGTTITQTEPGMTGTGHTGTGTTITQTEPGSGTGDAVRGPVDGTGFLGAGYTNVVLEALGQHAVHLLALGALDAVYGR